MPNTSDIAKQAIGLMDLTSLNDNDTEANIAALCAKADSPAGPVAAICIYPQFIGYARQQLQQSNLAGLPIATVTNFPAGANDLATATSETQSAVDVGADEVDLVLPYQAVMANDFTSAAKMVKACKDICSGKALLKVIIESGELQTPGRIALASDIALDNGADFIKTSTGKVAVNATLEAAEIMLGRIQASGRTDAGFKAAGGIRTLEDATAYLNLAAEIMGPEWADAEHFRFGASGLLDNLLHSLGLASGGSDATY